MKALKQKCKKGDTFYLLKRLQSQVGGIYLLVIPFAANHHLGASQDQGVETIVSGEKHPRH